MYQHNSNEPQWYNCMSLVVVVELTVEILIFQNPKSFPEKFPIPSRTAYKNAEKFSDYLQTLFRATENS